MNAYVTRLMNCKFDHDHAVQICRDFIRNLSLFDLECFIETVERQNVD